MTRYLSIGLIGGCLLSGAAAAGQPGLPVAARAELKDRDGRTVARAELADGAHGIVLTLRVDAAAPVGQHALHIHDTGTCTPPTFESAGGHFNPRRAQHGVLNAQGPHAGDLPNLHVLASGATLEMFVPNVAVKALLDGDRTALVLHGGIDDHRTDPAGGAGDRVACGVITAT